MLLKKLAAREGEISDLRRRVAQLEEENRCLEVACGELQIDRAELEERVEVLEGELGRPDWGYDSLSGDEDEWDRGYYPSGNERDYDWETL